MNVPAFLQQHVDVFKSFSSDRLHKLVEGSRVRSFEANEAILHRGLEATHLAVLLTGEVVAESNGQTLGELCECVASHK